MVAFTALQADDGMSSSVICEPEREPLKTTPARAQPGEFRGVHPLANPDHWPLMLVVDCSVSCNCRFVSEPAEVALHVPESDAVIGAGAGSDGESVHPNAVAMAKRPSNRVTIYKEYEPGPAVTTPPAQP